MIRLRIQWCDSHFVWQLLSERRQAFVVIDEQESPTLTLARIANGLDSLEDPEA
jgi:hypothetical protein